MWKMKSRHNSLSLFPQKGEKMDAFGFQIQVTLIKLSPQGHQGGGQELTNPKRVQQRRRSMDSGWKPLKPKSRQSEDEASGTAIH